MRIERYHSNQRQHLSGCGCAIIALSSLIIIGIIGILILPNLTTIGLRVAGFSPIENKLLSSDIQPIPVIQNVQSQSQLQISAGSYGSRTLTTSGAFRVQTGTDTTDNNIAQITLTESDIQMLCNQYSNVCSPTAPTFRNVSVDLQNGNATIAGEAYISNINTWQPIAVLVTITGNNQVKVVGVNINGVLFDIPDNAIGQRIREIQQTANQILSQLTLQTNGQTYQLSEINPTEAQLIATFR